MKYIKKNLLIDGLKLKTLAKKYSTPLYCYSYKKIKEKVFYKNACKLMGID